METVTLSGKDVLSVQKIVRREYKATVVREGKEVPSKMAGKFYWICSSPKGRIVVEEGSEILDVIGKSQLYSIDLKQGEKGWELLGFSTIDANLNMAKCVGMIAEYEKGNFDFSKVSPEDIIA